MVKGKKLKKSLEGLKKMKFDIFKRITLCMLEDFPENEKLCILSIGGSYTKADLIDAVKNETELGLMYIKMEMSFLKALLNDELVNELLV